MKTKNILLTAAIISIGFFSNSANAEELNLNANKKVVSQHSTKPIRTKPAPVRPAIKKQVPTKAVEKGLGDHGIKPVLLTRYEQDCSKFSSRPGFNNCSLVAKDGFCGKYAYKIESLKCCCDADAASQ